MIIVKLMGGLGNQMFQFAFGKLLSNYTNSELFLDLNFLQNTKHLQDFVQRDYNLDIFNYDFQIWDNKTKRRIFEITEDNFHNDFENLEKFSQKIHEKYDIYLNGFFQKHIYTDCIKNELINIFKLKEELSLEQKELLQEIINNENSIGVNFRKEFGGSQNDSKKIESPSANSFHGSYGMEYFENALEVLETKMTNKDNIKLYVFSDDIDWCKVNFKSKYEYKIIEYEKYKGNKFGVYMKLLGSCNHLIIPNSSFAWWSAYLNDNSNKKNIITPENWYLEKRININNLRPKHWITIK
jgi:hypothetical protein